MSINVDWTNPYSSCEGTWYKGNLHTHTSPASDCAEMSLEEALDAHADEGYDFLCISDHNVLTTVEDARMILLPGTEWNSPNGEHTGIIAADSAMVEKALEISDQRELLDCLSDENALAILNHPNWGHVPHYSREHMDGCGPYDGVEIINMVVKRLPGNALATDKWDHVLTGGRRVLGLAGEDSHNPSDIGHAWLSVRTAEKTPEGILAALRAGSFYSSTGVTITGIRREDNLITVDTRDAEELQALCDYGTVLQAETGTSITVDVLRPALAYAKPTYVRFEAFGPGSSMAWTQPFFLSPH